MDSNELKENKFSNYSKIDGRIRQRLENTSFTFEKNNKKACLNCEAENKSKDNYCKSCGMNLWEISSSNQIENDLKNNLKIKNLCKKFDIPKLLLTSVSAIFILLIISIVLKVLVLSELGNISEIVNPLHIILGMNLGSISIYSLTMMGSNYINANLGIIILLICPVLALTVSNLIFMRNGEKNIKTTLRNSLGVGITYGLILGIISIITKVRSNPYNMLQYGYTIEFSYNFISILINGFILGFLCTFILGIKKKYKIENKYISIFKTAAKILIIGYITILIILFVLSLSNSTYLQELGLQIYVSELGFGVVISQLTAYMLAFANLIPVTIANNKISIFNIGSSPLFWDTKLVFFAVIALLALLILLAGYKLKSSYKAEGIKPVLCLSIFYSILIGILAIFTSVVIGGDIDLSNVLNYGSSIVMGLDVLSSMIISFIYSFVIALIGYKLNEFN